MTVAMSTTQKTKKPKAPKLFPDERIDQLLAQIQNKDAESIFGESGLAGQLKKRLAECILAAELSHHLDTGAKQGKAGNHHNGTSCKTIITPNGELNLDIPRDRQATFERKAMNENHEINMSLLSQRIEIDGKAVDVEIYQDVDGGWILEVVDQFNNSTIWDDPFPTDQGAGRSDENTQGRRDRCIDLSV